MSAGIFNCADGARRIRCFHAVRGFAPAPPDQPTTGITTKKHLVFWALCLCGAPALGLGYLAGDWLVGTGWGRDMGALVGLATILGAACRYERLNDVFGFQRLGKRQNN